MTSRTVTSRLMGDPPPGRTPWAPPATTSAPVVDTQASKPAPASPPGTPALGSEDKGPAPSLDDAETLAVGRFPAADLSLAETIPDVDLPPSLRPVAAISAAGISTKPPATGGPIFEWVNPCDLLVDEAYQRSLSERSQRLIRRIVAAWDWRRFKPPVVALTDRGLEIIDGQHTAIAAATHPDIEQIPVMVVEAPEIAARAAAFVGHNTDRLGVTAVQVHIAKVAAREPEAQTIERVLGAAGLTLLRTTPGREWKPGETVAINAVAGLVHRQGERQARELLTMLAEGGCAPVTAAQIKAVESIITGDDAAGLVDPHDLVRSIKDVGFLAEKEAREFAAVHCVPVWKGLVHVWLKKCKRKRAA